MTTLHLTKKQLKTVTDLLAVGNHLTARNGYDLACIACPSRDLLQDLHDAVSHPPKPNRPGWDGTIFMALIILAAVWLGFLICHLYATHS